MFSNLPPRYSTLLIALLLCINFFFWGILAYRGIGAAYLDPQKSIREESIGGVNRLGGGPGSGK